MIRRRVTSFEYHGETVTITETHAAHVVRLLTGFWLIIPLWFVSGGLVVYDAPGNWKMLGLLWLPLMWLYMGLHD